MVKYLLLLLLNFSFLLAQEEKVVTFIPEKPIRGETFTVVYNPEAKNAKIKKADYLSVFYGPLNPEKSEKMQMKDGKWICDISLKDTTIAFLIFNFQTHQKRDDNEMKDFRTMVYNKEGKPVENAMWENTLCIPFKDRMNKDLNLDSLLYEGLLKELELYPNNFRAKVYQYSHLIRKSSNPDSVRAIAIREIETKYANKMNDKKTLEYLMSMFGCTLGDFKKANEINSKLTKMDPKFKDWRKNSSEYQMAINEKDKIKRKKMLEYFVKEYPDSYNTSLASTELFRIYKDEKDIQKLLEMGEIRVKTEKIRFASVYNSVAWAFVEMNIHLEKAVEYAQRAIELVDKDLYSSAYSSRETDTGLVVQAQPVEESQLKQMKRNNTASFMDTKGWAYYKKGDLKEAEKTIEEANTLAPHNNEINHHLAIIYKETGKNEKAYSLYKKLLVTPYAKEYMREDFKRLYIVINKSDEGYDKVIKEIDKEIKKREYEEMIYRQIQYDRDAYDFAFNKEGKQIRRSDYQGKVLVLNFWGMWCIPCKKELPYYQKLYDKYKNNKNVAFLAINTGINSFETELKSDEYIKSKSFTFPCVYDNDNKITERYNVEVIPSLILVNKNGEKQYAVSGYFGEDDYIERVSYLIDYLLKNREGE